MTRKEIGVNEKTASLAGIMDLELRLKIGGVVNGRYKIEEKLGEGGCGIVYKVTDTLLKTQLALKFLNPVLIADRKKTLRVKREINLSRKITDERVIKVFSLEKWNSLHFLVMEFVEGKSLQDILDEKKSFKWEEFKKIYFEILAGINVLHKYKIIHRDLKPSNIIVTKKNKIKILDFGLAKEINDKEKTSSLGELVGSPYYISPEQASGGQVDNRSDIYSLGVILYRALSGYYPFEDKSVMDIIYKHIHTRPEKVTLKNKKIPKIVAYGIEKALEKKKNRRFRNIEEMMLFLKNGKTSLKYWLKSEFCSKPFRIVLFGLLTVTISVMIYSKIALGKKVYFIEKKGSVLIAKNNNREILWEKNYAPYNIHSVHEPECPVFDKGNTPQIYKTIFLFLKHPQNNTFSSRVSLQSDELDSRIVYLKTDGSEIYNKSLIEAAEIETYDFAKITQIENQDVIQKKDIDDDGKEEIIFMARHSRGMFPTALFILNEKKLFTYSNPGGIDNYEFLQVDDKNILFYAYGFNNIIAHSVFFSEISLGSETRQRIVGVPNFAPINNPLSFYRYLVIFPIGTGMIDSYGDYWKNMGVIHFVNKKMACDIYWRKDYRLKIDGKNYECNPGDLNNIYMLINKYFQEKMNKNPENAYSMVLKALEFNPVNPFLKSALLYFKGDLEVLFAEYGKGRKTLYEALKAYPGSSDVVRRICEIEFLKGNPHKAVEIADREFVQASSFWGLGNGKLLFKSYCYLHLRKFEEAELCFPKILGESYGSSIQCFEGMAHIFKGNYRQAVSQLRVFEKEYIKILTVLELRFFIGRARILADVESEQARFYFDDIMNFSKTKSHQAAMSVCYFRAKEGKVKQAEKMAIPAFENVLTLAKGEFDTRLWLFYDAYIYAKTMEICNNKQEAKRGYRICIQANPHTDLAKRSTAALKRLGDKHNTVR